MNKYEKEVQASLLESETAVIIEVEKQYSRALNDIMDKVKLFETDIQMLDDAITEGINTGTMSKEQIDILLSQKQSKIYQKQYQEALQGQISGILDKLHSDNYKTIEGYLNGCYKDAYVGEMYDLANQGVPAILPINQASVVKAVLTDSKISKGLYAALGADVGKLKKRITQEISRGISTNMAWKDIARNLSNVSNIPLSRARTIIRTEGNRIQNTASRDLANNAADHGADLVKIWDATLDGLTRPSHRDVDGEVKELDEKFSNGLDFPGDPSGGAAEVCNCRCKEIHKPRWDVEGGFAKIDNFTGEVLEFDSPKDYQEFKEKYWSQENLDYMNNVSNLEKKYGTYGDNLSAKMSAEEYLQNLKYQSKSMLGNPASVDSRDNLSNISARSTTKIRQGFSAFPDDDELKQNSKKIKPDGNKFDVAMHGSSNSVGYGSRESNMSPRLLAEVIKRSGWKKGQPIRLLACNTGVKVDDDYCFAEELANALGVTVEAPNDLLYINKNGNISIGNFDQGKMISYKPNERKRKK